MSPSENNNILRALIIEYVNYHYLKFQMISQDNFINSTELSLTNLYQSQQVK